MKTKIKQKGRSQSKHPFYLPQKVASSQGSNEVSLANLPTGMYLLQVYCKDGALVKSEKVVLNR